MRVESIIMFICQTGRVVGERKYRYEFLARSFRDGKRVRREYLINLSRLPEDLAGLIKNFVHGRLSLRLPDSSGVAVLRHLWKEEGLQSLMNIPSEDERRVFAMVASKIVGPDRNRSTDARDLPDDPMKVSATLDLLEKKKREIMNRLHRTLESPSELTLLLVRHPSRFLSGLALDEKRNPLDLQIWRGSQLDFTLLRRELDRLRTRFWVKKVKVVGKPAAVREGMIRNPFPSVQLSLLDQEGDDLDTPDPLEHLELPKGERDLSGYQQELLRMGVSGKRDPILSFLALHLLRRAGYRLEKHGVTRWPGEIFRELQGVSLCRSYLQALGISLA